MNPHSQPYWYQPYAWTSATTATDIWFDTNSGLMSPPRVPRAGFLPEREAPPAPKSRDTPNVIWLRGRVDELCDLARTT